MRTPLSFPSRPNVGTATTTARLARPVADQPRADVRLPGRDHALEVVAVREVDAGTLPAASGSQAAGRVEPADAAREELAALLVRRAPGTRSSRRSGPFITDGRRRRCLERADPAADDAVEDVPDEHDARVQVADGAVLVRPVLAPAEERRRPLPGRGSSRRPQRGDAGGTPSACGGRAARRAWRRRGGSAPAPCVPASSSSALRLATDPPADVDDLTQPSVEAGRMPGRGENVGRCV